VNNAVVVRDKTIAQLTEADWDSVIEGSLSGTALLTKVLLPLLYKSNHGRIINIVSPVGQHGAFGLGNYAAAKGGLIAFTKSLAKEVGRKKILVNAVNPGFMLSNITKEIPNSVMAENKNRSCLGTLSDPCEVAQFILYLASDAVQSFSGQVFHCDSRIY